jgi:hypothetical protein
MLRLVVAGMGKNEIKQYAEQVGGEHVQVAVVSDMEGARAVKAGLADYYVGACASGRGGALSIAIAILGYSNCAMVSTQGHAPATEDIKRMVLESSSKAFGINYAHASVVVGPLVEALLEKHGLR